MHNVKVKRKVSATKVKHEVRSAKAKHEVRGAKADHSIHTTEDRQPPVKKRCLVPVSDLLPEDVVERLRDLRSEPMTALRVREIAKAFDTEKQFGVSPRRLGYFLRKLRTKTGQLIPSNQPTIEQRLKQVPESASEPTTESSPKPAIDLGDENSQDDCDDWPRRVQSHRRRQVTIASILDSTFGKLAENSPDLWAKRAYLMLVGVVYDRLVSAEKELDTDELIKLAKVLAEGRRAELRAKGTEGSYTQTQRTLSNGAMPKHLVDTVRQIYGVSLEDSASSNGIASDESLPADTSDTSSS